jgi:hypothetical protein
MAAAAAMVSFSMAWPPMRPAMMPMLAMGFMMHRQAVRAGPGHWMMSRWSPMMIGVVCGQQLSPCPTSIG